MNKVYLTIERRFEILTEYATKILGNSISFLLAVCLVLYWWINDFYSNTTTHQSIGDFIFGITFLSLFIIQKSFNRYSALIHLKMNELISSHETANNDVMNASQKTEREIIQLHEEYAVLGDTVNIDIDIEVKESEVSDKKQQLYKLLIELYNLIFTDCLTFAFH